MRLIKTKNKEFFLIAALACLGIGMIGLSIHRSIESAKLSEARILETFEKKKQLAVSDFLEFYRLTMIQEEKFPELKHNYIVMLENPTSNKKAIIFYLIQKKAKIGSDKVGFYVETMKRQHSEYQKVDNTLQSLVRSYEYRLNRTFMGRILKVLGFPKINTSTYRNTFKSFK